MWMVPRSPSHYLIKIKHLLYLDFFFFFREDQNLPMGLLSWSLTVATPLECALTGNVTAAKGGELLGRLLKSPSGGLSLSLRLPVLL